MRALKGGDRWPRWAGVRPGDDGGETGRKGGSRGGGSSLLGCHCLPAANIDDALTSLTFGWVLAAAGPIDAYYFMWEFIITFSKQSYFIASLC